MILYFRCYRCNPPYGTEFAHDGHPGAARCPNCKATGMALVRLTVTHFQYEDMEKGPMTGTDGRRWAIGCKPDKVLANYGLLSPEFMSPDVNAVTCPACKESAAFTRLVEQWGIHVEGGFRLHGCNGC